MSTGWTGFPEAYENTGWTGTMAPGEEDSDWTGTIAAEGGSD